MWKMIMSSQYFASIAKVIRVLDRDYAAALPQFVKIGFRDLFDQEISSKASGLEAASS